MIFNKIIFATIISGVCLASCTNNTNTQATPKDTLTNTKVNSMKSYVSMIEIPATDILRAINFYETVLNIKIEKMDVEDMQMGIWHYENQLVNIVIIKANGYKPSADGATIYLNAGENLQIALDRVEKHGGQILVQKTAHADGSGYFAVFLDSEGNKMALNSPN